MRIRVGLYGVLFVLSGVSMNAGDKITIKASPEISFAPAHLVVRASVEADPANRALEVVLDSEDYYRSSMVDLDGEHAPRTSILEFRGVPSGTYEISVRLLGVDGQPRALERRMVNVIETGK